MGPGMPASEHKVCARVNYMYMYMYIDLGRVFHVHIHVYMIETVLANKELRAGNPILHSIIQ